MKSSPRPGGSRILGLTAALSARFVSSITLTTLSIAALSACSSTRPETTAADLTVATGAQALSAGEWVAIPAPADPSFQNLTIPTDAPTKGMWSATQSWPLNGLHATLLPDGRVLTFGTTPDGRSQDGRYLDAWSPAAGFGAGSHVTSFESGRQDSFCATSTFLYDGRLMVSGGNDAVTSLFFDSSTNGVATSGANMAQDRWYATMITLPDGRPLIVGGMAPYAESMQNDPDAAVAQGLASMTPEVWESSAWRSLFGAYSRDAFGPDYLRASYPRAFVAPDGRVFGLSAEKMWYLDPSNNGTITTVGTFKGPFSSATPVNVGATNTAVMYAPGKILVAGGNGAFNGDGLPASRQVTSIDINGGGAVLTELPQMTNARRYPNAVVLADGKVVVTGGTRRGNNAGSDAVYPAEIWNPTTNTWTVGANAANYRGYHSFSILLPSGAVLSTGGGTPGPVTNLNAELYYPPFLFRAVSGVAQLAPRPVMTAMSGLSYSSGATVQIDMADTGSISQLVLIGVSNGTHSFNSGQRRIPLTFTQNTYRLTATIPGTSLAPPGYYQVVAVDANGVASRGAIVAVGQGVAPPPVVTTPYNPPNIAAPIAAPVLPPGALASYTVPAIVGATYSWDFGDGSPVTAFAAEPSVTHAFAAPGVYTVTLSAMASDGSVARRSVLQAVSTPKTAGSPSSSSPLAIESRAGAGSRLWAVNPDNASVSVVDLGTNTRTAEIAVGSSPRTVAVAPDGRLWVVNRGSATISVINPSTLAVAQTVSLPRASAPHGIAFAPSGSAAFVVLEGTGQLLKLDPSTGAVQGSAALGAGARHVAVSADGATVLVSRFITPPLPGEATPVVDTAAGGAEVLVVDPVTLAIANVVMLRQSTKADNAIQGSGVPNYLAAPVISPDGSSAWIPSKQDNVARGTLRSGLALDFQNTVRAISSRVDMASLTEDHGRRIDHDDSGVATAAAFHPSGVYLFVALETSRQVAVLDALRGTELLRLDAGRAPQGVAVSADGRVLYVQNFMDRTVSVLDLTPLVMNGELRAPLLANVSAVGSEALAADVLLGKRLFYDARDPRLARDGYLSCASCHEGGGNDGRVWDLTGFGEGLRNTIALAGRAGTGHGFLHWSANFDELQDFEKQIRDLAGGTGLMTDAQFGAGTRSQPLGDPKAGLSADLDALAAYLRSLSSFSPSPYRNADGTLTAEAVAGKAVFEAKGCGGCHGGAPFTVSAGVAGLRDVGTIRPASGNRLGAALSGIDVPTLRDVWTTAPYLHDGSAANLSAAVLAHAGTTITDTELTNLVSYLRQIGSEELGPGVSLNVPPSVVLTSPAAGASFTQGTAITLSANAADTDGSVAKVEFFDGNTLVGTDSAAPYTLSWTGAATGAHTLAARAHDNSGATTTSASVSITVTAPLVLPVSVGEWTFNTASGTTSPDTSGKGKTLTLGTGVRFVTNGLVGPALQLLGTSSPNGAATSSAVVTTSTSFSVSGWIRFDQLPSCKNQAMASQDASNVSGFTLGITGPCNGQKGVFTFVMRSSNSSFATQNTAAGSSSPALTRWYHLTGVRNTSANTMALYVDGAKVRTLTNSTKWSATGAFVVGRAKSSGSARDPAYASIDSVRAFNRALTDAEVTTLFQAAR